MRELLERLDRTAAAEPPFLRRVRLCARRRVLWMRELWAQNQGTQGLAISDGDVDRILAEPAVLAEAQAAFYREDPEARAIAIELAECERQIERDERWTQLIGDFGLSDCEAGLLALALMVETDPWWRRVCGYLQDDAAATHATPWLAASVFGWKEPARLGPLSPIVRWYLARPASGAAEPWSSSSAWLADPAIAAWLADGVIKPAPRKAPDWDCLYPGPFTEVVEFARRLGREGVSVEIELSGPEGAGKETLAAQACSALGWPMISADAEGLTEERMVRTIRSARLNLSACYWRHADSVEPRLWQSVRGETPLMFFGAAAALALAPQSTVAHLTVKLPKLGQHARRGLWQCHAGQPPSERLAQLPLLPGEIAAAAWAAPAGERAIFGACTSLLAGAPGELFGILPLPYTWDDIVLAAPVKRHLEEIECQARLRASVLEDWEFERLTPMGRGVAALFAGPSGTGKTMAVQVIGRSLGLEVRRVDLSAVVNKYIGETEKRLKAVFDACERTSAILFFDEADALFGQRTQVRDAHDRFANIEINYLLQRMEQFDGIAILATNRKEDLDRAFVRRLRFIVDFLPPGPAERRLMWRKALPYSTSTGVELLETQVDLDALGDRFDLNGASIKSAALRAAFLARHEGGRIGMRHILTALGREMQKHGQVLRQGDMEGWR